MALSAPAVPVDRPADGLAPLLLPQHLQLTADQFAAVCQANPDAVLELDASGQLIRMTPTGSETGARNTRLLARLQGWADRSGGWLVFASSSGFRLPDGSEQQAAEQLLFCTVTALALVRLVCQPKLMGAAVKTAGKASALLEAFCMQPGVSMAMAEQGGWEVFHQLQRSGEVPARLCTDAYLAAVAMANGWRLVSFDRDFERFEGLDRLALPGAQ